MDSPRREILSLEKNPAVACAESPETQENAALVSLGQW